MVRLTGNNCSIFLELIIINKIMERNDIYTSLSQILGDIIGDTRLNLTELTTTDDISGWSSLVQTQLVIEIEKHFNCHLTLRDIMKIDKNISSIVTLIENKQQ